MTSVLTYGGLNYQNGNPLRGEIIGLKRENENLKNLVHALYADVTMLRVQLGKVMPEGTILPSLATDSALAPATSVAVSSGAAGAATQGAASFSSSVPIYNSAIRRN